MLIRNLKLNFFKESDDKIILKTENEMEIALSKDLLAQYSDRKQSLYLTVDDKPVAASEENQKKILNELLDN